MTLSRLLVGTDFSDGAGRALRFAADLAGRLGATLDVAHVLESDAPTATAMAEDRGALTAHLDAHLPVGTSAETTVLTGGAAAPALARHAAETEADLIVVGTHGRRGLGRLLLGSAAEELLRMAPCPVLTFREAAGTRFPQGSLDAVLVPLDLSEASLKALPLAKALAAACEARLHLLHVVEEINVPGIYGDVANPLHELFPEVREKARAEMERAVRDAEGPNVPAEIHFAHGDADDAIVDFAEEHGADLAVMTREGRRGLSRFLIGSTTEKVVRAAPCPVAVVPTHEEG